MGFEVVMMIAVTIDLQGNLLMEGLLLLLLGSIKGIGGGRFDIRNRDSLLWTRLMHGDGGRTVLSERRFLWERVCKGSGVFLSRDAVCDLLRFADRRLRRHLLYRRLN